MGLSAAEDRAVDFSRAEQCGVLVTSIALVLLTIPLARCAGMAGAAALESIAGLAFGATSVAAWCFPGRWALDHLFH